MSEFVFKGGMDPKGDQPQAIEKLIKGVQNQQQFQTLLGATGTGKSVTKDTEVIVYVKDEFDNFNPTKLFIGDLIDDVLENSSHKEIYNDTEVVFGCDVEEKYFVPSFNPVSKKNELKPVSAFIRHDSPDKLYKVVSACGREAVFTGDHNFYVLRNGELTLIETIDIREGDYFPVPLNGEFSEQQGIDSICLLDYIDVNAYVDLREKLELCVENYGKNEVYDVMKNNGIENPRAKFVSERVNLKYLGGLISDMPLLNCFDYKCSTRLGDIEFDQYLPLDDDFLKILGVYLAEGFCTKDAVIISVREKEFLNVVEDILNRFGWKFSFTDKGDIRISSMILAELFTNLCGTGSFNKKLPDFWPMLSTSQLALILKGYFTGDGGVEKNSVNVTTASKNLASDLLYALNRFGIWGRLKNKFKRATNSNHKGNYYYSISISGQGNINIYLEKIGFLIDRKNLALEKLKCGKGNANVDLIPGIGSKLVSLRKKYGLRQKDLAEMAGLSRSAIGLIENEQRNISRNACERLLAGFKGCEIIDDIKSLLNLRWSPVLSVEEIESEEDFVYDFSVKDNETFLAGFGGMFVHNTFVMAKIVEELQRPTLVLAHNKTLAAQLASEFQEFFPDNAVSYFVSYYDYYQPEAYMPATDTYIEKDASINEEIDKFRHAATTNLLTRKDVLIVASVSCIYGLGSVEDYNNLARKVTVGEILQRDRFLRHLTDLQYSRSHNDFKNGMFHVLGDTVEVFPPDRDTVFRIEFFGDEVDAISEVEAWTGEIVKELEAVTIFPAKHDVTSKDKIERAVEGIRKELEERYQELKSQGRNLEAERIKTRTEYDIEIMLETGYCSGIENYTRYLSGGSPGSRPSTLLDYLPDDFLLLIDESHITVPQIGGMHNGNYSRKQTLIEHGFRLPSAHDNRPLKFDEFEEYMHNTVFVSATPGKYELGHTNKKNIVELIVRPTGLVDPEISVRPSKGQIEDLLKEIEKRVKKGDRVLITTLTKRSAEDLTDFLTDADVKVKYLHSDIDTIERIEILRDLRMGKFDVLVGINLLREGLDLPEVSLVAILDADKRGFLRSASALIQTVGRAARNADGFVIMYADTVTEAMQECIDETNRRREKQVAHNKAHGITPQTIKKAIRDISHYGGAKKQDRAVDVKKIPKDEAKRVIESLENKLELAVQNLEFEKAAELRDEIEALREELGV